MDTRIVRLGQRAEQELRRNILPFWMQYPLDPLKGGFFGALTNDRQVHDEVERSLVLCARVLWTFSAAYRKYADPAYLALTQHAYRYLVGKFVDPQYGGMYWWLDCEGRPVNARKQTYGQAFAIYGLSEYFLASGEIAALNLARSIFTLIEQHASDPQYGGYVEGRERDWGPLADMRLSEKEPFNCPKSMNTLLHVLEGYTNLLRAWPAPSLKDRQASLIDIFLRRVIDPRTGFTRLFFENDWRSLSDLISFGHDIETSWLLVEGAEVLGDQALIDRSRQAAIQMAGAVYAHGLDADGSVFHEGSPAGIIDDTKHWWCQAEGVVGFLSAYQVTGEERYAQAALRIWDFIETKMVDQHYGEWYKVLDRSGIPLPGQVKTGPWEDPYHQARACLEIMRRAGQS